MKTKLDKYEALKKKTSKQFRQGKQLLGGISGQYSTLLLILLLSSMPALLPAQRLEIFTSETGKLMNNGVAEKVPYKATPGFYDFLPEGLPPDTVLNGNPGYFIYFEIPYEVTEIGIRLISPVPGYAYPEPGDVATESFESSFMKKKYFDPLIYVEQGMYSTHGNNSDSKPSWTLLGKNDDSDDALPQPTGNRSNSVLRLYPGPYPAGIYRVTVTTAKKGVPEGSYLVHFGTIPGVKRMKMSRTIQGLAGKE